MTPSQRALLLDTAAAAVPVAVVWALATHRRPGALRICGAELVPDVADEPWVCTRPPHPGNQDHQAPDGSTWRD